MDLPGLGNLEIKIEKEVCQGLKMAFPLSTGGASKSKKPFDKITKRY